MANLLTRKVMENMSRQYRKDHAIELLSTSGQESRGNINANEEALLLGLIKKDKESPSHKNSGTQGQRLHLDDLAGCRDKGDERNPRGSSKVSLEELAQRQK